MVSMGFSSLMDEATWVQDSGGERELGIYLVGSCLLASGYEAQRRARAEADNTNMASSQHG